MGEVLYSLLPLIIALIFLILGLLMNLAPGIMLSKEERESEAANKRIKKTGTLLYYCTVIMVLIYLIP